MEIVLDLSQQFTGPFWILYVLIVSRTGKSAGRYQAPDAISRGELRWFLNECSDYLEHDGCHHIWVEAENRSGLLVYDNHNVIYAYGPLEKYERVLASKGLHPKHEVRFPVPHRHRYNQQFDDQEDRLLRHWARRWSALHPDDDL